MNALFWFGIGVAFVGGVCGLILGSSVPFISVIYVIALILFGTMPGAGIATIARFAEQIEQEAVE